MIVNVVKTKVMVHVFRLGGKLSENERFFYDSIKLEIVNWFQYVGLFFTPGLSLYRP